MRRQLQVLRAQCEKVAMHCLPLPKAPEPRHIDYAKVRQPNVRRGKTYSRTRTRVPWLLSRSP